MKRIMVVCHVCGKNFWAKNKKQVERAAGGLPVFHSRSCAAIYGAARRRQNPDAYQVVRQQERSLLCPWESGKIKGDVWQRQVAIW